VAIIHTVMVSQVKAFILAVVFALGSFLVMQLWTFLLIWNVRRHLTHIKR